MSMHEYVFDKRPEYFPEVLGTAGYVLLPEVIGGNMKNVSTLNLGR